MKESPNRSFSTKLQVKSTNLNDFCYAYFGWMGRRLSKAFRGIERDLDAAYMKVNTEVYFSIISFIAILTITIPFTLFLSIPTRLIPESPLLSAILTFSTIIPFAVIAIGRIIPRIVASNRISSLKIEIPYASMYISVMTSGGLSPFESLLRMRHMALLPEMQREVSRIETIVRSTGVDPVTAIERAAKVVNLNDYKELLLGYASTVRTGGDTLHYLFNQTKNMFRNLSTKIKTMGERIGMLMEAYTIVGILGVLGLFLIFVMGMAVPGMSTGISSDQFFLFSFVVLPVLSIAFVYLSDAAQISYPLSNWKTYVFSIMSLPPGLLLGTQLVLPYFYEGFPVFPPANNLVLLLRRMLNLAEGTEASLGLAMILVIVALPGVFADYYFAQRERAIQQGISTFLRDLVETRKSGLSPERCIESLSSRDYRAFSSHLRRISLKLRWGYPLRQIYDEFRSRVQNWLALVNVYLLIDTIDVCGGTEESLETLAEFSESTRQLEDEKKAMLMPLTIVPYIGGGLLTATTVMFLDLFTGMSGLGISIQHVVLLRVLLPPLVLHSFVLGIVTGKMVSGRVSAGFKHAVFMVLVAMGGIWAMSNLSIRFGWGSA